MRRTAETLTGRHTLATERTPSVDAVLASIATTILEYSPERRTLRRLAETGSTLVQKRHNRNLEYSVSKASLHDVDYLLVKMQNDDPKEPQAFALYTDLDLLHIFAVAFRIGDIQMPPVRINPVKFNVARRAARTPEETHIPPHTSRIQELFRSVRQFGNRLIHSR